MDYIYVHMYMYKLLSLSLVKRYRIPKLMTAEFSIIYFHNRQIGQIGTLYYILLPAIFN